MTTFRSRRCRSTNATIAGFALVCLVSRCAFAGWFSGMPPTDLGAVEGRLKPCPDRPNCVSSQAPGAQHVEALGFGDSPAAAIGRLKRILDGMPRTRVVAETTHYLRAEAASRVFGFVDDMEFLVDPAAGVIHVRSAARMGYSDFGVNRRRIEAIRSAFDVYRISQ